MVNKINVWLLDKPENYQSYENIRFQEEANESQINLRLVASEAFDLIIPGGIENYKPDDGNASDLVNCLVIRLGSDATHTYSQAFGVEKARNRKWQIASLKRRVKVRNSKWQKASQKRREFIANPRRLIKRRVPIKNALMILVFALQC